MNKVLLLVVLVGLGFGGWWYMKNKQPVVVEEVPVVQETIQEKTIMVSVKEGGEVWLSSGTDKVSMFDISIVSPSGNVGIFELNKELFNSELLNQIEETGNIHAVAGVMKSTSELPMGEIMIGRMLDSDNPTGVLISGKATLPAEGEGAPTEVSIKMGGE